VRAWDLGPKRKTFDSFCEILEAKTEKVYSSCKEIVHKFFLYIAEEWQSGRMRSLGKRVYRKVPQVRILSPPPCTGEHNIYTLRRK
jgi:hypothetical protein